MLSFWFKCGFLHRYKEQLVALALFLVRVCVCWWCRDFWAGVVVLWWWWWWGNWCSLVRFLAPHLWPDRLGHAAWAAKSFVLLNFYCSLNLWRQRRHSTGLGLLSQQPTGEGWLYRFYSACFCCIKSQPTSLGICRVAAAPFPITFRIPSPIPAHGPVCLAILLK